MSQERQVTIERRGDVLLIGLNRVAKRNAFDLEVLQALGAAYGQFEQDQHVVAGSSLHTAITSPQGWTWRGLLQPWSQDNKSCEKGISIPGGCILHCAPSRSSVPCKESVIHLGLN